MTTTALRMGLLASAFSVAALGGPVALAAEPTVAQPTNCNAFPGAKDDFDPTHNVCRGLEIAHFGTAFGCVFRRNGEPYHVDFAAIARAYGLDGVQVTSAAAFKPALEKAVASGRPCVIDVAMMNEPVPTAGHWNVMDIYSPDRKIHHASIE